ncbi:ciliary microtubule associated protein 1A-like [Tachypleus tridentatus]|uniref:ciliary microtubule associated protein 1A-like n=1 Tax=Tachypleus tridentatus TaxID=6853 RepID=UPI003FD0DFED
MVRKKQDKDKKKIILAAQIKGPGPGKYLLPGSVGFTGHDITKRRNPAFSFGSRTKIIDKKTTPGPCYLIPSSVNRYGRIEAPAYTLSSRPVELEPFASPGPGAYSPEKFHPPKERRAPSYSITGRPKLEKEDLKPAPNAYTLPTCLGPRAPHFRSLPSYTISSRSTVGTFDGGTVETPGPNKYEVVDISVTKTKSPGYTLSPRIYPPGNDMQHPGPGAYNPELVILTTPSSPAYSMGIRHSEYITELRIQ